MTSQTNMRPTLHLSAGLAAMLLALAGAALTLHGRSTHHAAPIRTRKIFSSSDDAGADAGNRPTPHLHGDIPPGAYLRAFRTVTNMRVHQSGTTWQEIGPTYAIDVNIVGARSLATLAVAGRATAIALDPASCAGGVCRTIYVGTIGGGVWKTTNAGWSWRPLTDNQPVSAIGSLALDPKNPTIVYAGTGNTDWSVNSHYGLGILRSTDGGATWTLLGQTAFADRAVATILVDPRTAGTANATIYAGSIAVDGNEVGHNNDCNVNLKRWPAPACGFYTSKDGGRTWTRSNPRGVGDGLESLVMDPTNPNVLYGGFTSLGIYRSADDGATWTRLGHGLPKATADFGRVSVAIAPADPHTLYAAFDLRGAETLYRSTDGGSSWTRLRGAPVACGIQCWTGMQLAVDPAHPRTLYVGGSANYDYLNQRVATFQSELRCLKLAPFRPPCSATLMKTTDSGVRWADIGENEPHGPLHPDDRAIAIDPTNPNVVYVATDGGVYHSADGGRRWGELNDGLDDQAFYSVTADPNGDVFGGTQDNGVLQDHQGTWFEVLSGDGGDVVANPTDANVLYESMFGASLWRNDGAGDPVAITAINPFWHDELRGGITVEPFTLAPSNHNDLFFGTYRLWRSERAGGTDGNADGNAYDDRTDRLDWRPISFDLTCARKPPRPSHVCAYPGIGISAIGVSSVDPNVIAVGTSNGHVWLMHNALARVTTDHRCDPRTNPEHDERCNFKAGVTWTRVDRALPNRYPTAIAFAPRSTTTLYVSYSDFNEDTPGRPGHVFASTDAGRTWHDADGAGPTTRLPDLPINDVIVNPRNGHLYAAADYGVFVSTDGGAHWSRLGAGLPDASVQQINLAPGDRELLAATYGRGLWQIAAP